MVLIFSDIGFAVNTYTCNIDEGLQCVENNCEEKYSNGQGGFLRGENNGTETWDYMRFDETTCSGTVDFNSSTTKAAVLYWYTTAPPVGIGNSVLRIANTNNNGDASIEYCTDDSVLGGGGCTNTEDDFESEGNRDNDFQLEVDNFGTDPCSGSTCNTSVLGTLSTGAVNDNEQLVAYLFRPSNDQEEFIIAGSPVPKLSVIVNYAPELDGCPDDFTEMNSDGTDIFIDLWECHEDLDYDGNIDDNDGDNIYTIDEESNSNLTSCNVTDNQYVLCGPPAENQTGYTDIIVKVDDSYNTDNDTIRIYVNPKKDVSIYVNDTKAWSGLSSEYSEVDILEDLRSYLDLCESDSEGNCQIPIKIQAHDGDINFSVNSIDINYNLYEVDFQDALQDYLDNDCTTSSCTVPLTFDLNSEGNLRFTDLQIFYTPIVNTVPSNSTILYPNGSETIDASAVINWTESVDTEGTYDFVSYFLQYSNDSGTSWYDIALNYGYENELNDSSTEKNITFSGDENKTIYLRIPKNAHVLDARIDLTGLE